MADSGNTGATELLCVKPPETNRKHQRRLCVFLPLILTNGKITEETPAFLFCECIKVWKQCCFLSKPWCTRLDFISTDGGVLSVRSAGVKRVQIKHWREMHFLLAWNRMTMMTSVAFIYIKGYSLMKPYHHLVKIAFLILWNVCLWKHLNWFTTDISGCIKRWREKKQPFFPTSNWCFFGQITHLTQTTNWKQINFVQRIQICKPTL